MKRILKYLTLVLILAVSCQKQAVSESDGDEMTFIAQLADMTKASSGLYTETNLQSLGEFQVTGYDSNEGDAQVFSNKPVYYVNNLWWKFKDNPTIWLRDHDMTFWAKANLPNYVTVNSTTKASATLAITEIPSSASNQCDPLIGYYSGVGESGSAVIKFYHPLTAVSFKTGMCGEDPVVVSSINSVKLTGVYKSGSATVTGSATSLSYNWASTRTGSISVTGPFSGTKSAQPFLLIPQNVADNKVTIEVTVTRTSAAGGGTSTMTVDLDTGSWEAGIHYTYTLDYVSYRPLEETLKVTLTDWVYIDSESGKKYFDASFDD